ncbi:MAG: hypothetical protein KBA66_03300 [Leptospiraceae bacterium]|nr:hypothetical protein [Leptospiraceae bacterium]
MKDWKLITLVLLFLIVIGVLQSILYSPLTPKAAAIAHFKINPKLLAKVKTDVSFSAAVGANLTETDIEKKYGRLELVTLLDSTIIRGAVIEQGEDFIRIETSSGIQKIQTDKIDTVEIIR